MTSDRIITINGAKYMPFDTVADTAFNWSVGWILFSLPLGCFVVWLVFYIWEQIEAPRRVKQDIKAKIKHSQAKFAQCISLGDQEKANEWAAQAAYYEAMR